MRSQQSCVTHWRARLRLLRDSEAAQLLEFAFVLPMLVVMVIGAVDFGAAWLLKDKLSNAARDGARIAASQFDDLNPPATPPGSTPASVTAVRDAVANYLTNAKVTSCAVGTTASSAGPLAWQYTSGSGGTCSVFLLKIERGYTYLNGTTTVVATRVTLKYPFNWSFGHIIKLLAPSSTYANSITLSTNVVMENLTN